MKITARIELPKKLTAKFKELKMPLSGGYEEGYDDGYKKGYVVGEGDGYVKGETDGRESGYADGLKDGSANFDAMLEGTFTEVSNDTVESIKKYAFYDDANITKVSFSNVKTIGDFVFKKCSALQVVYIPNATNLARECFNNCSNLCEVSFPKVETLGQKIFENTLIVTLCLPKLKEVDSWCLANMPNVTTIDLHEVIKVSSYGFQKSTKLTALILRNTSVVSLGHTMAFDQTPIANGTGYIYVPSALIEQYKVATNWSTFADQFRAIEDYPDICGGAE